MRAEQLFSLKSLTSVSFVAVAHPYVPGYEAAGRIAAIGAKAAQEGFDLKVGDSVLAYTNVRPITLHDCSAGMTFRPPFLL